MPDGTVVSNELISCCRHHLQSNVTQIDGNEVIVVVSSYSVVEHLPQ